MVPRRSRRGFAHGIALPQYQTSRRARVLLLTVAILGLIPPEPATAAVQLDPTFSGDGVVLTPITTSDDEGYDIAVDPTDDGIVVVGSTHQPSTGDFDYGIARYLPNGSPDTEFNGGTKTVDFSALNGGSPHTDRAFGVAIQPVPTPAGSKGKIVVVGHSIVGADDATGDLGTFDFSLARLNADGSLDKSFDGDGLVTTAIGPYHDDAYDVVIQPDGKIVVAGATDDGSNVDFALARYNKDGSLDKGFSGDGVVTTDIAGGDHAFALGLQSTGDIVVGGYSSPGGSADFSLARYSSGGAPLGTTVEPIGSDLDLAYALEVQANNSFVMAGYSAVGGGLDYDFAVARFTADGALDPAFGTKGKVILPIGSGPDIAEGLAVDGTGRITVVGTAVGPKGPDFGLLRLTSTGKEDPGFAPGGKQLVPIGEGPDTGKAVVLQPDGKVLVAGYGVKGSTTDFAVARLAELAFTLTATPDHVWANGHRETTLTATLRDAAGNPVVGEFIVLSAFPDDGVVIGGSNPKFTNAEGKATFTATSTKIEPDGTPRKVTFAAASVDSPETVAITSVVFEPRKIVVQVLGVDTSLRCGAKGKCKGDLDTFEKIRGHLKDLKFKPDDFIWYSYRGGTIDAKTGTWLAKDYRSGDTAKSYAKSIRKLVSLIHLFGGANPNTRFSIISHSQGGLISLQEIGFLGHLPPDTDVESIITLDAPLGGIPRGHAVFAQVFTGWGTPAANQIVDLYHSTSDHAHQGSTAKMLCTTLPVACSFPDGTTNNEAVLASPSVHVATFGNSDDAIYKPHACKIKIPGISGSNRTSQIIGTADARMGDLGGNEPLPHTPIIIPIPLLHPPFAPRDLLLGANALRALDCISNSHHKVSKVKAGAVAGIIGGQFEAPLGES